MLHAFIDESGITVHAERASDHFTLSAVVVDDESGEKPGLLLNDLREQTGRQPGQQLHFVQLSHGARRYVTSKIGTRSWIDVVSVVVCKRAIAEPLEDIPAQYNYTFRFLLERLSWLAKRKKKMLTYTAAHLRGFPIDRLTEYEQVLRGQNTQIKWEWLETPAGEMINAADDERLQLADIAASATAAAFETDEWDQTEDAYFKNLAPRLFRSGDGASANRYGIKFHPSSVESDERYKWACEV